MATTTEEAGTTRLSSRRATLFAGHILEWSISPLSFILMLHGIHSVHVDRRWINRGCQLVTLAWCVGNIKGTDGSNIPAP